ncbi:diguanylate cyclase [Actinoplanes sp. CA-142083]|uniref:GGDEF domain-containing protein n=1 Tax=Actinoplanes sp. CA-142083 TaxID=3239903 RepID=UPI003D8D2D38
MPAGDGLTGERVHAIEQAYALIEAAQGELSPGQVDDAAARIGEPDWWDVQVLLHFARSLAVRDAGGDDAEQMRAMLDVATALDDPALLALALAASAARRVGAQRPLDLSESAASPLVRAAVLLNEEGGPVVHRAAALIEVACVAHALGFWELALEHYDRTHKALDEDDDPRWQTVAFRHRTVLAVNRIELLLDWSCAEAMIGDWPAAATRAAAALPGSRDAIAPYWPPSWIRQYDGHLHLLSALAGHPSALAGHPSALAGHPSALAGHPSALAGHPSALAGSPADSAAPPADSAGSPLDFPGPPPGGGSPPPGDAGPSLGVEPAISALGAAIAAVRAADPAGAAILARGVADRFGQTVPLHTWLLALQLEARQSEALQGGVPRSEEAAHGAARQSEALQGGAPRSEEAAHGAARQSEALQGGVPRSEEAAQDGARRAAAPGRFADELVRLRWNDRLVRMSSMRDAIAVARHRREHDQLLREIVTDHLTGLANRRGYQAYLSGLLDAGQPAEPGDYAAMMIDVDHFKQVNDRFGHDVGDRVLAAIAAILSANVRAMDLAARLGGDEFVVILAQVHPGVSEARARAILEAVRDHPWHELAADLTVSISVGLHHGGHEELPTLLGDADRHLYRAKNDGRGRVAQRA